MEIVKINGTEFKVNDGIELSFNGFEELNNAKMSMNLPYDIEFAYFDEIVIDDKYYFYLVDYEKEIINPEVFKYSFDLVNPSIGLQNIILPNRAVEKGTDILTVFERYKEMYLDDDTGYSVELLRLIARGKTAQLTWAEPTLYEVFNTLLQEYNAVITMTDFNTISYIKLDKRGRSVKGYDIKNIISKSDYTNHATKLKSNLQNAISSNIKTEVLNFITPNEPVLNDSNFLVETLHPIEKVISLEFHFAQFLSPESLTGTFKKNITPMLVEKFVYDTYLPSNSTGTISGDYKRTHLYFETGKNYIGGLDYNDKTWVPIISVNKLSFEYWGSDVASPMTIGVSEGIRQGWLVIKYEAQLNDIAVESTKNALATVDRRLVANQDEAFIDLDLFARKQMLTLDRSGTLGIEIYGEGTPPEIMDYYDDFNIYMVRVTYNIASISWFALAQRGFSYFNLREKVSSEKVFSMIETADKAFLSNHITNYDFEFTEQPFNIHHNFIDIVKYFDLGYRDNLTESYVLFNSFIEQDINDPGFTIVEPLLEKYGNSLLMHFNALDNSSFGKYFESGFYKNRMYVDDTGNFEHYAMTLFKGNIAEIFKRLYKLDTSDDYTNEDVRAYINGVKRLPFIKRQEIINIGNANLSESMFMQNKRRYKTNREITAETVQFNLLGNEKVIIWDDFLNGIGWGVNSEDKRYNILINSNENLKYSKMSYDFGWRESDITFSRVNDQIKITIDVFGGHEFYGFVLFDDYGGKPLMAYNGTRKTLYLREAYKRDRNDYEDFGEKIIFDVFVDVKSTMKYEEQYGIDIKGNIGVSVKVVEGQSESFVLLAEVNVKGTLKYETFDSIDILGKINVSTSYDTGQDELEDLNLGVTIRGIMDYEVSTGIEILGSIGVGAIVLSSKMEGVDALVGVIVRGLISTLVKYQTTIRFFNLDVVYATRTGEHPTEYIYSPPAPTRTGYRFDGWFTSEVGGQRINWPIYAPAEDMNVFAQWIRDTSMLTWQYRGKASQDICFSAGYNPIGDACSSDGDTMIVSGSDIGMSGNCHVLVCKI